MMKLYSLILLTLLTMTAAAQEPATPAKETSSKPPGDPYVKKKPAEPKPTPPTPTAGGSAGAGAASKEAPPHHLLMTFETYRLPQEALDALFEKTAAGPALYEEVRKLVHGGGASLETVMAVPSRSGQRASIESNDEYIYPTEFQAPTHAVSYGFPTSIETRLLGERIEVDPVEGPDGGTVDMNFTQEITKLVGFNVVKSGEYSEGELQPLFASRKIQTIVRSPFGQPTFCGTLSEPHASGVEAADGDGSVSVTFVRTNPCPVSLEAKPGKGSLKEGEGNGRNIRFIFRCFSLPREVARDLLAETVDAEKLHARLAGLPAGQRKLERLLTLVTHTGNRSLTNETAEWLYSIEIQPPQSWDQDNTGLNLGAVPAAAPAPREKDRLPFIPAGATSFESRPVGWQVELDPVLGPGAQWVDVNLAPAYLQYRGTIQGHPLMARYPEHPLFSSQKILTAVMASVGKQCFLGTMSPPRDTGANGRKDDGRTWFAFMKATLE